MAPSPELMGAVERKARELGVWTGLGEKPRRGWNIRLLMQVPHVVEIRLGDGVVEFRVDPLTAALWLLLHAAGITVERPCPVQRCRAPDWSWSGTLEHRFDRERDAQEEAEFEDGRVSGARHVVIFTHGEWVVGRERPCPTCTVDGKPTGRVHIEAARVLLDAMPKPAVSEGCRGLGEVERTWSMEHCDECDGHGSTFDAAARDDLDVIADTRMAPLPLTAARETDNEAQGRHALGHALALWLRGELREEHVMGVEVIEGPEFTSILNENMNIGRGTTGAEVTLTVGERLGPLDAGWVISGCHCIEGEWQPGGRAHRHVLEARPA